MDWLLQLEVQQPGGGMAQIGPGAGSTLPQGGLTVAEGVITNAFNIVLIAAVLICAIFIAYSGLQWINSGGDKQKVSQARARLTWTIVGLVIVFLAILIVRLVGSFFGVTLL